MSFLNSDISSKVFVEASMFKGRYKFIPSDFVDLVKSFKRQHPNDWAIQKDKRNNEIWLYLKGSKEAKARYSYDDMLLYIDKDPWRVTRGQEVL